MSEKDLDERGTSFSRKLAAYRLSSGLTQQQVANYLTVNRSTYTKYETGVSEPSIATINKLAKLFSVDVTTLIEDNPNPKLSDRLSYSVTLSKTERDIIAAYRRFDRAEKKRIIAIFSKMLQDHESKRENKE